MGGLGLSTNSKLRPNKVVPFGLAFPFSLKFIKWLSLSLDISPKPKINLCLLLIDSLSI